MKFWWHSSTWMFFFFCTFVRIASNGCSDWNSSWSQAANFYKMRTLWMQCALWIQFRHTVVATTTTDWNHILCIMNFTFVAMSAMFPWRYFCIAWYDISAVFVKHIFPTNGSVSSNSQAYSQQNTERKRSIFALATPNDYARVSIEYSIHVTLLSHWLLCLLYNKISHQSVVKSY